MKKIISIILVVCMLFISFTINVFAQTTDVSDKITLTDEEATALYETVARLPDPSIPCIGKQLCNAGNCALILGFIPVGWEFDYTENYDDYKITVHGLYYSLWIYDGNEIYSLRDAINANIVTIEEVYEGYDTESECPAYFKIEKLIGSFGDANGDGDINIADATEIQKACADIVSLGEIGISLADVNNDGFVSILDVTCIQKYIANTGYDTESAGEPCYVSK